MNDKKLQQLLKGVVNQVGTYMFAWEDATATASALARQLNQQQRSAVAVHTFQRSPRTVLTLFPEQTADVVLRCTQENEQRILQLRSIVRELRDLVLVINDATDNAMDAVVGMPLEIIRDGAIFTAEHVIELAELAKGYELQLNALTTVIQEYLTSLEKGSSNLSGALQRGNWERIDQVLASDESRALQMKVDAFVYNNNLKRREDKMAGGSTPGSSAKR